MVECLITSGADINAVNDVGCMLYFYRCNHNVLYVFTIQYNVTPLHYASQEGHSATLECLITSGADVNAVDDVSCMYICFYPHNLYCLGILLRYT